MQTKERFRPHVAVLLFLIKDNQVLLQRRFKTGYADGWYSLISGHIDGNEQATNAMVREAKEEGGITIDPKNLHMVHIDHRISKDKKEYIDMFFTCSVWEGEPKIMEPHKHDDLSWFPIEKLPENTLPFVTNALKSYQNNIFYSEFGWNSLEF
jgi:8-oxo-dGTP pyrophosphatase MutT (NUDIX family)